jgi:lipid II:glycine glycyltransferase (peptidoglycan interpeptide bridge formation enzyme)
MIAGILFLTDGRFAHMHLSGSRQEHRALGPNNFVLFNSMLVAKSRGCRVFHMGGGATNDPHDTLFRFKRHFSRDHREFYVARSILDPAAYDRATAAWRAEQPAEARQAEETDSERFPPYGFMGPKA